MKNFNMSITRKILTILLICLSCAVTVKGYEIGDEVDDYSGAWKVQITSINPRECKLLWKSNLYAGIPAYINIRSKNGIGTDRYAVTTIGSEIFKNNVGMMAIRTINIPNTVRTIENWAFKGLYIYELIIPESVTYFDPGALDNTYGFLNVLDRSGKLPPPVKYDQYENAYVVTTTDNYERLKRCQYINVQPEYKDLSFLGLSIWESHGYPGYLCKYPINKAYLKLGETNSFNVTSIPSIPHVEVVDGEDVIELHTYYQQRASEIKFFGDTYKYNDEELLKHDAGEICVSLKAIKKGNGKLKIYNEIGDTIYFPFCVLNNYPTSIKLPKELEIPINTKFKIPATTEPEEESCILEWTIIRSSYTPEGCKIDENGIFIGTTPGIVDVEARLPRKEDPNNASSG